VAQHKKRITITIIADDSSASFLSLSLFLVHVTPVPVPMRLVPAFLGNHFIRFFRLFLLPCSR
jgi:hypothetical protein